ncbi:MAG: hypothetical protein JWP87_4420 [Labilithrix sp.]|nr:hypothetical protein [Labilithrix sp.]
MKVRKTPRAIVGSPRSPRIRRIRAAVAASALAGALCIVFACGTDTSLSGPGEECFAATDCQAGLVCVPQRGGARFCSNDLSQVTGRPPPEGGAAEEEAGGDGPVEGTTTDAPSMPDTSMPDTSMPDTSVPVEAGGD